MAEELSWRPPTPRHEDQPRWSYLVNGVIKDYRRQGISGVFLPLPGRGARRHLYGKVYEDWKERNEEKRPPKKTTEPKPKADEAHERSSPAKTRLEKLGSLISGIVVQGNAKEKKGEDKTKHVKLEPRPQDRPRTFNEWSFTVSSVT
ncbi:MAG: hypothetical protein M1833_006752 [Piccolia ochrophora]|nr:MAG: hypothetical protein M1833_006752 [Piccolia ochrophora]